MKRLLLPSVLFVTFLSLAGDPVSTFESKVVRETRVDGDTVFSTHDALAAIHRLVDRDAFAGMSRNEVLRILGNPEDLNSFNQAHEQDDAASLTYRFDHGLGGWEFTFHFADGKLSSISKRSLD
ncbi:MAG: hypothetical protein CMO55_11425 [Verrucomicrobiales bacterium]|nr:hypothetical protein [Verrucomicrobiales bacterium]